MDFYKYSDDDEEIVSKNQKIKKSRNGHVSTRRRGAREGDDARGDGPGALNNSWRGDESGGGSGGDLEDDKRIERLSPLDVDTIAQLVRFLFCPF